MSEEKKPIIALLGQPNSGKSTLFNGLTGANQHVGNWPGKTVEKKEGEFSYNGTRYIVADLPGSYSLSANSDEEVITRDYIATGKADIVCVLVDTSQIQRSLYMLADYAGIQAPVVVLLNMMDVAKGQGKTIDAKKIEQRIGVPVIPFVAADKKAYGVFYKVLEENIKHPKYLKTESLERAYEKIPNDLYKKVYECVPEAGVKQYSRMWLATKFIEGDRIVRERLKIVATKEQISHLKVLEEECQDGNLYTGNCKFEWIQQIIALAVSGGKVTGKTLGKFDTLATSKIWGKPIAIGAILVTIMFSMLIAMPIMTVASMVPNMFNAPLSNFLNSIGVHQAIISLICDVGLNIIYFAVSMAGFVLGITFGFNLVEEIGYMARISFVFEGLMSRLGLQGKSIMAFFMGAGCTIGGAAGTRVVDNWGQRVLAIALVWSVPCGATWAMMPTLASIFFGANGVFVMITIIIFMFIFMGITAKVFGNKLAPKAERTGMIMEMPPYHKPHWKNLLRVTLSHSKDIFLRAIRVISLVAVAFWILSYSSEGDITQSIIYKIGITIEPITKVFGLGWQTFMAFVASAFSKEAVLGVLSSLYTHSGSVLTATLGQTGTPDNLSTLLIENISKAEALAFIFATTFNVPCIMALASTYRETHSGKWTGIIAAYYTAMALILSCVIYHIGLLIF